MKFEITIYSNNAEIAKIKNLSKKTYEYLWNTPKIEICPDCEQILPINIAKSLFGDWTNDTYGEKVRRKQKGIDSYEITIVESILPKKEQKLEENDAVVESVEDEFIELIDEPAQCIALTKKGTRCKREAEFGSEYCTQHDEPQGE